MQCSVKTKDVGAKAKDCIKMNSELEKAQLVLEETSKLAQTDVKLSKVCQKLSRKIKADILFLQRCQTSAGVDNHEGSQNVSSSSNIPYLSGILDVIKQSERVTQVIYDLKKYGIVVDVVCNDGRTWKKVVARNPQALHLIWAGKGQYGSKDVVKKAEKYIECSKRYNEFAPPRIVCVFCNGVTFEMAEALECKGIKVEGNRVEVSAEVRERLTAVISDSEAEESDDECESVDGFEQYSASGKAVVPPTSGEDLIAYVQQLSSEQKVFLDITTMLVCVSDLCNGGCNAHFHEPVLVKQAADERQKSALQAIQPHTVGKQLVTCQSALKDYLSIVRVMGGDKEKERTEALVKKLIVVPDCLSDRFASLKVSGQIRQRSKVIFGAADNLRCDILTSNEGFVRAACAQGVHVSVILHQPRALTERKRLPPTPTP